MSVSDIPTIRNPFGSGVAQVNSRMNGVFAMTGRFKAVLRGVAFLLPSLVGVVVVLAVDTTLIQAGAIVGGGILGVGILLYTDRFSGRKAS